MNKSKIFMIVSICILCISLIGTTVAYYTKTIFNETASTITHGLDYYINYENGQTISTTTLTPSKDYKGGAYSNIEFWKDDDTYDIYGHIYLDITTMSEALSESSAIKYTIVNNNRVIAESTVQNNSDNTILMAGNIPLKTTEQLYTVYIWLEDSSSLDPSLSSSVLSLSVRCEATMKPIDGILSGAALHIYNLYLNNKDDNLVVNNNISYRYASIYDKDDDTKTRGGLMNDRHGSMSVGADAGNVRYYGANPNNYIYFNCSDYSNQSSSTCELWRIVGVFDGKVKIMRNESLGSLTFNREKRAGGGFQSAGTGWDGSQLQTFLNNLYYDRGDLTTYLYYIDPIPDDLESVSIDLANNGIKNNKTRGLISESIWYLRGWNISGVYPNQIYEYERYSGNINHGKATLTGNIGLLNASDYGYSADFNVCSGRLLLYRDSCLSSNWMYAIFDFYDNNVWSLTGRDTSYLYNILSSGGVNICYPEEPSETFPVLHLKPTQEIASGDGSQNNPYKLLVE